MHSPDLLPSCPPPLSEKLERKMNQLLSTIVRANYNTQFAQTASELAEFRDAMTGLVDGIDNDVLSESFRKAVRFTSYSAYAPLVERFSERPCKESAVANLLAPGLPDYLVESSSTSGNRAKVFPKYNCYSEVASWENGSWTISDPLQKRTKVHLWYFWCDPIPVEDENNRLVKTVYNASGSTVAVRGTMHLYPEEDGERMGTFISDHTAPYAAGFIKNWRSTLVIQALFALCSRSVKTVSMVFIGTFVDMMRHLDTEFDTVVECIANGTIPDLSGIADVRHYLEMNMSPDPERAAELRGFGRPSSQPGWCALAWPNMHSITAITGGCFAISIPFTRWFLGPNVGIHDAYYACTEGAVMAHPYSTLVNGYKPINKDIIEFLDITSDSISGLVQPWEVELGKRYEVVLTTRDGLWRYRLDDVIEIFGFDPTDGVPIIRFIERRNVALRFDWFLVSEEELRAAVSYMAATIPVQVVNWTATIDDRRAPDTIGFFVEIANDQGAAVPCHARPLASLAHENELCSAVPGLARAADHVLDKLSRANDNIAMAIEYAVFRKPTVRLVQPGTFSDFLQLKVDEGVRNISQVKVPVVLPKQEYVTWFSDRVLEDL